MPTPSLGLGHFYVTLTSALEPHEPHTETFMATKSPFAKWPHNYSLLTLWMCAHTCVPSILPIKMLKTQLYLASLTHLTLIPSSQPAQPPLLAWCSTVVWPGWQLERRRVQTCLVEKYWEATVSKALLTCSPTFMGGNLLFCVFPSGFNFTYH